MPRSILARNVTYLVFLIVLCVSAYANSINVPFHFDDEPNIVDNPIIKDFSYFTNSERAVGLKKYNALRSRYIGFLTFFLNYKLDSLNVTGYHIVNIFIHLINALLVYALVMLSFQTPAIQESNLSNEKQMVALLAASLFAVHPVNTEAVTYIVQRLASLVALFYLGSMVCYVMARLSGGRGRWFYYAGALILAVLAMKTKENAFTLPLAIASYEFIFFKNVPLKKRALLLTPLILTMLIIPLTFIDLHKPAAVIMSEISEKTVIKDISRYAYFTTELRVMVTYLRLLVLPINQNLDYDYPLYNSPTKGPVLLSLMFILSLIVLAVYLYRRKEPASKLGTFGIIFFFLAISVESTLVPLQPIFEHRAYLPGVGILIAGSVGAALLYKRMKHSKAKSMFAVLGAAIFILLLGQTVQRNTVWRNDLSLWSDVVRKAPNNARAQYNLGTIYRDQGNIKKAISLFRKAIELKPDFAKAHYNLAVRLNLQGKYEEAIKHYDKTVSLRPEFSSAYHNLGVVYYSMGHFKQAEKNFKLAEVHDPKNPRRYSDLGTFYFTRGDMDKAIAQFKQAVALDKKNAGYHYNLGHAYFKKGMSSEADQQMQITLHLDPKLQEAKKLKKLLMK